MLYIYNKEGIVLLVGMGVVGDCIFWLFF